MNTHLDHVGVAARREGISLMLDKVNELSGNLPVVVTATLMLVRNRMSSNT